MNPIRSRLLRRSADSSRDFLTATGLLVIGVLAVLAADTVPIDVVMPGTQPDTPENAARGRPASSGRPRISVCSAAFSGTVW